MYPFGITVEFQRSTLVEDEWGNMNPGEWSTTATVDGVVFVPGGSMQIDEAGRVGLRTEPYLLGVPNDIDVRDRDRCLIEGDPEPWGVIGDPLIWRHPITGWEPGQEIKLERVEG